MYIELLSKLNETKFNTWKAFLNEAGLEADISVNKTVLLWDNDVLIATGSRDMNLIKCVAVRNDRQGEGLLSTVLTALKKDAFSEGIRHLFLYTKPQNEAMFSDLFFYPVAQTDSVLLMEDKKDGINQFLNSLPLCNKSGKTGCIVMNCNPFTLGHRFLIETTSNECKLLYVFVVSEDKSQFSAEDRLEMVRLGTSHISNVCVVPTGPYLVSHASFPTYFLKNREDVDTVKCMLDIEIFIKYYAKKFNITVRYVGTEPLSPMTNQYNIALKEFLPKKGISVNEIPRFNINGTPVSASAVRNLIKQGNTEAIHSLVPDTTFKFLSDKGLL